MQIMFILFLAASFTALCLLVGIGLLFSRKTRPFGLYAMMVEPGSVLGLAVAALIWTAFISAIRPALDQPRPNPDWTALALVAVAAVWFSAAAIAGAVAGFALATWLWWRFSPEPYRSKIVDGYRRFVSTVRSWHRPRWNESPNEASTDVFDPN
jgi:hypothetical protein